MEMKKPPNAAAFSESITLYRVDSISNPQASRSGSGMYLEFLLRRAHSRRRFDRRYWSGVSLNSFTACSNDVTIGITGPMGSGLPQLGLPRLFAIINLLLAFSGDKSNQIKALQNWIPFGSSGIQPRKPKIFEDRHLQGRSAILRTLYYTEICILRQSDSTRKLLF